MNGIKKCLSIYRKKISYLIDFNGLSFLNLESIYISIINPQERQIMGYGCTKYLKCILLSFKSHYESFYTEIKLLERET